jgi:hypothetical protein
MKWRYVAYAVSIAGLGTAVLTGGQPAQDASVSEAVPSHRPQADVRRDAPSGRASDATSAEMVLALVPRRRLFESASTSGPTIAFASTTWARPASSASAPAGPVAPDAPPFTYVGRQLEGSRWLVLVADKDAAPRAVQVGDLVDDDYRVASIGDDAMVVDYLPTHTQYSIPLE